MLGENVDIHGGGIDLKFPHHHNEYLQTTCYVDNPEWIKCFVHTGHLHVSNEKMSQSLGNFITIKNFLKKYTSQQIRILFLMTHYSSNLDLSEEVINTALAIEKRIYTAYRNLESQMNKDSKIYNYELLDAKIHEYFNNDFDTPNVIKKLLEFIDEIYADLSTDKETYLSYYLFLKKWLDVLGINYIDNEKNEYIDAIVDIRNSIKEIAMSTTCKETKKKLFGLSDNIRDDKLVKLGVHLEDVRGSIKWYKN
jgi:cysteinyl-tRNA synthetase